jgi:hypothetical protein
VPFASNRPIVTCFGSQSNVKKLITRAKVSSAPLFVQRSNVVLTHTREQQNWKLQLLGNLRKKIHTHVQKTKLKVTWKFTKLKTYLEIHKIGQGSRSLT